MNIGEFIKKLREERKLSINQLALYSDVSAAHISRIERGLREPSPEILKKVSQALKVPYEDLMKIAGYLDQQDNNLSSKEDEFITKAQEQYGYRGKKQAKELLENIRSLFDGGELPEEDRDEFFRAITEIYFEAKEKNKKYTPKKYRKNTNSQ